MSSGVGGKLFYFIWGSFCCCFYAKTFIISFLRSRHLVSVRFAFKKIDGVDCGVDLSGVPFSFFFEEGFNNVGGCSWGAFSIRGGFHIQPSAEVECVLSARRMIQCWLEFWFIELFCTRCEGYFFGSSFFSSGFGVGSLNCEISLA